MTSIIFSLHRDNIILTSLLQFYQSLKQKLQLISLSDATLCKDGSIISHQNTVNGISIADENFCANYFAIRCTLFCTAFSFVSECFFIAPSLASHRKRVKTISLPNSPTILSGCFYLYINTRLEAWTSRMRIFVAR